MHLKIQQVYINVIVKCLHKKQLKYLKNNLMS